MKTYVLTVSRVFPSTHKRKGEETGFVEKIIYVQNGMDLCYQKIHTIRSNYPLWEKRIKEVQEGKALLSLRYWSGKPYNSKQVEFARLDNDSGIGCVEIKFAFKDIMCPWLCSEKIRNGEPWDFKTETIAKNDGLSEEDFKEWFKKYDLSKPMAIIHFTKFRY